MSAYQVETSKYSSASEAIADSFAPGYKVHIVTEVGPDLYYVLASNNEVLQAYEYRVEVFGGLYSMRTCTVDVETAAEADPVLKTVAQQHGAL